MCHMCLLCLWPSTSWVLARNTRPKLFGGNAADLSLLTRMTVENINRAQSVGGGAQESYKKFILHNNQVSVL
jgi:hypothetical protein